MEIKSLSTIDVLKFSTRTTLKGLNQFTLVVPEEIERKAEELGIATNQPQIWQYTGSDGNPDTEFLLEICVPVSKISGDAGKFKFAQLPASTCLSHVHKGDWNLLGKTYAMLIQEITSRKLIPSAVSRELYVHCDFQNQENCITEVQILLE